MEFSIEKVIRKPSALNGIFLPRTEDNVSTLERIDLLGETDLLE